MDNEVRDQIIVDLRQDKDGYDPMAEEAIAEIIGISQQRVNQVLIRLLGASKFITDKAKVREASKRYIDAITLKPHALTCWRKEQGETDATDTEMGIIEKLIAHHRKRGVILRGPDGRVINWLWCLSTWDKLGKPVVYASPGDPFYDLALYMYPEKISPRQLQSIAAWLEDKRVCTRCAAEGNHG